MIRRWLVLVLTFVALMVGVGMADADEAICPGGASPDPNVIYCEDFEWSAAQNYWNTSAQAAAEGWESWHADSGGTLGGSSGVFCNSSIWPASPHTGACGMVLDFPSGTWNGQASGYLQRTFTQYVASGGSGQGAPIFWRIYAKISSSGFVWHPVGNKFLYLYWNMSDGQIGAVRFFNNGSGQPYIEFYETNCHPDLTACQYGWDLNQNQGGAFAWNASPNVWHAIEGRVIQSTPGVKDGRLSVWVDGVLKLDYQNLTTRMPDGACGSCNTGTGGFMGTRLDSYLGGSGNITHSGQQIYYDNLVISKAAIGLIDDPPIDTTPPGAPTNFRVTPLP